ncbi:YhcN/YlaJ family sporulation lipoprotein [Paenibacillus sp. CC-CFT747]|nr:YhcN/YlaJ family sporulation lipoprotein [Paenibacillus sp. CC-CFT747]
MEEADNISHGLKQEIASIIRNAQPSVHEVYISAHRDFVNLMNGYAQDSARGLPLDSRVQEFNGMVNRVLSLPDRKTEDKIINGTVENKRNVR